MQRQGSAGKLCLVLLAVLADVSFALTHDKVLTFPSSAKQVDRETILAARTKREAPLSSQTPVVAVGSSKRTVSSRREEPLPAWAVSELDSLVAVFVVMLLVTILIAVMVWWSSSGRDTSPYVVVEPVGAVELCRGQMLLAAFSIAATSLLASAELPALWAGLVSTAGLLADSAVATTLLLRTLLCFVDGEQGRAR